MKASILAVVLMSLVACSSGLQETAFRDESGIYIVSRSLVNDRMTANQPHVSGVFACDKKVPSELMAEFRAAGEKDYSWYTQCQPIARIVQSYLTKHPDPDFSSRAARALTEEYQRLATTGLKDADEVFWKIVQYVASNDLNDQKRFWAALGIVSHYFELCDIFER